MARREERATVRARRKWREGLIRDAFRESQAADLARIRSRIARLKARKSTAMRRAVALCQARRKALREERKRRRAALLAELRAEFEASKAEARRACAARKERVRQTHGTAVQRARAELQAERAEQRAIRSRERKLQRDTASRVKRAERQREKDDEVRANLPPELVPVWERVRRRLRVPARASRTEAFLEWVEENPGEVAALQEEQAERELRQLIRQEARQAREAAAVQKVTRARLVARALDELRRLEERERKPKGAWAKTATARGIVAGKLHPPDVAAAVRRRPADSPLLAQLLGQSARELAAVPF